MFKHVLFLSPMLLNFACGSGAKSIDNGGDDGVDPKISIRSFEVSGSNGSLATANTPASIQLKKGSKFGISWNITSNLPMSLRIHVSKTSELNDNSKQIYVRNCDVLSKSQCENWADAVTCEMKEDNKVVCGDNISPSVVNLDPFVDGPSNIILETCALFTCQTASVKVSVNHPTQP